MVLFMICLCLVKVLPEAFRLTTNAALPLPGAVRMRTEVKRTLKARDGLNDLALRK